MNGVDRGGGEEVCASTCVFVCLSGGGGVRVESHVLSTCVCLCDYMCVYICVCLSAYCITL